jgi:hypothetical protein
MEMLDLRNDQWRYAAAADPGLLARALNIPVRNAAIGLLPVRGLG